LFHLEKSQDIDKLTSFLPHFLSFYIFSYGSAGVAVFFVISGFVINHSLSKNPIDGHAVGKFLIRRSIRIDPAYWLSICLAIIVNVIMAFIHKYPISIPTPSAVVAHIFYMQEILNYPEISPVYWTLTYEIQFYIVISLCLWMLLKLKSALNSGIMAEISIFLPLYIVAFWAATHNIGWAPHGLFLNLWDGFFLGFLAYDAGYKRKNPLPLLVLSFAAGYFSLQADAVFGLPCAATALILFACGRRGALSHGLSNRALQWGGTISYSLYLVHVPVIRLLSGIWQRSVGRGVLQDTGAMVVILGACFAAAHIFHRFVELPSQKLSTRIFQNQPQGAITPKYQGQGTG